ncbi:LCP family glycopolymer transferase [Actinokineospora sp.]|uniref:LCP family glycopolymer transferase n=1 Tax=Actinokineospora sp. TaxID=1872133 RepID=UPI004037DEB2
MAPIPADGLAPGVNRPPIGQRLAPGEPEVGHPQGTGEHPDVTPRPDPPGRRHPDGGHGQVSGRHPIPDPTGQNRAATGLDGGQDGPRPHIPRQQPPGQSSMPRQQPPGQSSAPRHPGQASLPGVTNGLDNPEAPSRVPLTPPPNATGEEMVCLTTEMEAIGEATQKRRRVDETLARFSKVHDDLKAEERARKSKRSKLNPWAAQDDEMEDHLDELAQIPGEPTVLVPVVQAEPKKSPKRSRSALVAKLFAGATAVLVFIATGVGWGFKKWADESIDQVRALDPNSSAILNAEGQRGDENFLLVGSDTREGAEAEEGVGDAGQVPGARSDTVMIAHVPADRKRVVVVSFPRDLEISRPECERFDAKAGQYTGERATPQQTAKMNSAYQIGGPLCVTKVVQQISGLQITRFIGIDFTGFKGMVDAVDGVRVCVEKPMYDTFLKKWIVQEAGTEVELRGDQALDFVRSRHVRGDPTSDYGRIKRQQRFLSSLLRKAMSGQILLDPSKLTDFTGAFAESTFGDNIGLDSLFQLGRSLGGLEAGRVTFVTVPTVGEANGRGNEVLRKEDTGSLFRAIINDQPLPGEQAAAPPGGSQQALPQPAPLRQEPVDPKTLKIQVLNGGNETGGIARRTADKLAAFGYTVVQVNAGPSVPKTVVRYGKGNEAAALTLASSVPGAELQQDPSMAGALVLVLGPEYKGQVIEPGTGETPTAPEPEPLPNDLSTINGGDVTCA